MSEKVVVVKGRAGLGNRMQSAMTGILYARLARRRLVVDWRDKTYSDGRENAFHRYFTCALAPDDTIPQTGSVLPAVWRGNLDETAWELARRLGRTTTRDSWRLFSIDFTRLGHDEDVLVMWTFTEQIDLLRSHFRGEWERYGAMTTDTILREMLRDDLRLQPSIRARVERFRAEHFTTPTAGVHVRYSDHRVRLRRILSQTEALLKRQPELRLFLSTDSIEVKLLFERAFPRTITTAHWYARAGERLHDNAACPDAAAAGEEALVDLYLLAECDHLIIDTSSSFAQIAVLMSRAPAACIVDVHPPYAPHKTPPWIRRYTWRLLRAGGHYTWGLRQLGERFVRRRSS